MGLLADLQLRSLVSFMDVVRYDWAHTFLADSMVGLATSAASHAAHSRRRVMASC